MAADTRYSESIRAAIEAADAELDDKYGPGSADRERDMVRAAADEAMNYRDTGKLAHAVRKAYRPSQWTEGGTRWARSHSACIAAAIREVRESARLLGVPGK